MSLKQYSLKYHEMSGGKINWKKVAGAIGTVATLGLASYFLKNQYDKYRSNRIPTYESPYPEHYLIDPHRP